MANANNSSKHIIFNLQREKKKELFALLFLQQSLSRLSGLHCFLPVSHNSMRVHECACVCASMLKNSLFCLWAPIHFHIECYEKSESQRIKNKNNAITK